MVSRKLQRERKERNLQHQNDIMVERIVRMRSYNTSVQSQPELPKSQQRQRKNGNISLILPIINEHSSLN